MPTATDLPVPAPRIVRYERLGFGLFVHWGLYSQLAQGEWIWYHHRLEREAYVAMQAGFTAKDFDALALVRAAKAAGCRYVCLTTRHHEGFSLYDTRGLNTYDAPHSPAGRDLIAEFSAACEAEGLAKFFYHTTLDWWHEDFDAPGRWQAYLDYLNASVEILCTHYGRVDGLWFDGNWARRDRDWKEDELYALIRRHQPECIIVNNSSIGQLGAECHNEVDVRTFEQGQPQRANRRGKAKHTAMEMCDTIHSHWGVSQHDISQQSPGQILRKLIACRAVGANYLLNVGPSASGGLEAYDAAVLGLLARWQAHHPELIESEPTDLVCRGDDCVLRNGNTLYYVAFGLEIHNNGHLSFGEGSGLRTILGDLPPVRRMTWTDSGEELVFSQQTLPANTPSQGGQPCPASGSLTFRATRHPYGANWVARVARVEV